VSTPDARSSTELDVDPRVVVARYGNQRAAVGSTLFAWLNLTLMLTFGWPALVVLFDLPSMSIERMPMDWFLVRFGILLAAAVLTVFFWRSSPVPTWVLSREAAVGVFQRGVLWTQGTLVLLGVCLVLAVMLLLANQGQAARLLAFGIVDAFAVQALMSGYMKTAFDILLDRRQSFLLVLGLFTAFFGLQSMALAVAAVDSDQSALLALIAGATLGAVLGSVSLLLRDRSSSLLPGYLLHLFALHLVIPFFD